MESQDFGEFSMEISALSDLKVRNYQQNNWGNILQTQYYNLPFPGLTQKRIVKINMAHASWVTHVNEVRSVKKSS
jgi:hypothetical protein